MRPDIDPHLLAQAVIALGHQLAEEEKFFEALQQHDARVGVVTFLPLRMPACMLAGRVFVLFDGGHLVCWLPEVEVARLAKQSGFELWRPRGTDTAMSSYVKLPSKIDKAERLKLGLAALAYAQACAEQVEGPR